MNDGITNPVSVCNSDGTSSGTICNNHPSVHADDDGGYIRLQAASYYASPAGNPTATPTPPRTPTVNATPGTGLLGDINADGIVDIRDYGLWRQSFGVASCGSAADLNVDCVVDIRDYGVWRQHFGQSASAAPAAVTPLAPRVQTATPTPLPSRTPTRR